MLRYARKELAPEPARADEAERPTPSRATEGLP